MPAGSLVYIEFSEETFIMRFIVCLFNSKEKFRKHLETVNKRNI